VRYPWPVLDAAFPRSLKRRARNIVLRERAGDTNTQDNYDQLAQPSRDPVHSRPPRAGEPDSVDGKLPGATKPARARISPVAGSVLLGGRTAAGTPRRLSRRPSACRGRCHQT
jgi:hypothetical protein